jgi:hypothetical protein
MIARMIGITAVWLVLMGAPLFGAAGTLAWPAAWLWLLEFAACGTWLGLWLARVDPGLLAERVHSKKKPVSDDTGLPELLLPRCA